MRATVQPSLGTDCNLSCYGNSNCAGIRVAQDVHGKVAALSPSRSATFRSPSTKRWAMSTESSLDAHNKSDTQAVSRSHGSVISVALPDTTHGMAIQPDVGASTSQPEAGQPSLWGIESGPANGDDVGSARTTPKSKEHLAQAGAMTTPRTMPAGNALSEADQQQAASITKQIAELQRQSDELVRRAQRDSGGVAVDAYSPINTKVKLPSGNRKAGRSCRQHVSCWRP